MAYFLGLDFSTTSSKALQPSARLWRGNQRRLVAADFDGCARKRTCQPQHYRRWSIRRRASGWRGAGPMADVVTACHNNIQIMGKTEPNPDTFETCRHAYQVYRELYPLLRTTFTQLI